MNDRQRQLARKNGGACGYKADGGIVAKAADGVKSLFGKEAPKDEASKNTERQKRIDEMTRDAAESSARAVKRQGTVYPGANAPYADGGTVKVPGKIPGVDGSLPKKHEVGDDLRKEPPAGVVRAAGGGIIGSVSGAIERVGRTFGTEKAKKIEEAEESLKRPQERKPVDAYGRAKSVDAAEREALEGKAGGGFIQAAIKRPGQLHRDLGVPQGEKIPPARIAAAAQGSGKVAQRARFAQTLAKIRKG